MTWIGHDVTARYKIYSTTVGILLSQTSNHLVWLLLTAQRSPCVF